MSKLISNAIALAAQSSTNVSETKGAKSTSRFAKIDPAALASKKQRTYVYFASKEFGVNFNGIWTAEVTHGDLSPAITVLHKKSKASRQEKLDALDYVAELGVEFTLIGKPNKVERQAESKAPTQNKPKAHNGNNQGLAYGRYCKEAKKNGATPMSYETFMSLKNSEPKAEVIAKAETVNAKILEAETAETVSPVKPSKADVAKAAKIEAFMSGMEQLVKAMLS